MTSIEWTRGDDGSKGETWNPVVGCRAVSEGCRNCFAKGVAHRGMSPQHRGLTVLRKSGIEWNGKGRFVESALDKPVSWKKPRRVFVDSMSDVFFEEFTNEQIAAIFAVMAACPQHTFILLTKRPARALEWFVWAAKDDWHAVREVAADALCLRQQWCHAGEDDWTFPLPNVDLLVSVEDQATADERIPLLLSLPAARRGVSYEPALGAVDFEHLQPNDLPVEINALRGTHGVLRPHGGSNARIDWVICGGESGAGARPMHPDWARSARDQCVAAGVPFFFKQWGAWAVTSVEPGGDLGGDMRAGLVQIVKPAGENDGHFRKGDMLMRRAKGKTENGRVLDGRTWDEFPAKAAR